MVAITAMEQLATASTLVIKVGSSLLVDPQTNKLSKAWMRSLAADIAQLKSEDKGNKRVLLVSSGAVAAGRYITGLHKKSIKLEDKQALAAIGQIELSRAWVDVFAEHGLQPGQVLLTLQDTEDRRRWLNSSSTLDTLLQWGIVPVINENDSVASDEIRYGDNDRLAARTAQMIGADLLVLLSDVDGLYTANPMLEAEATHIPVIKKINRQITAMAGNAKTDLGSGGMITKILAAKIAAIAGCATLIGKGAGLHPLQRLQAGETCSLFLPDVQPAQARKNWIANSVEPAGKLLVDAGAAIALGNGASLLAAGLRSVEGEFERGSVVLIASETGEELARGLVSYDAKEAKIIKGMQSADIAKALGYDARKALVHRDNLVLTG